MAKTFLILAVVMAAAVPMAPASYYEYPLHPGMQGNKKHTKYRQVGMQ